PIVAAQPVVAFPSLAAIIADGCSAATSNGGRRQTPDAAVSPSPETSSAELQRRPSLQPPTPEPPAAVAGSQSLPILRRKSVASTAGVLPRRRLQCRQSLLIAVELPLRHCRRRPSPSPHPAAAPS
ncbi:unnamed protein product, partial [Cuscuta campestris]